MKSEAIQAQESFDAWLLRKNRLEKGINLLKRVKVEHGDDISEIFLASVAIDCSMRNLKNISSKANAKSMKRILKEWLSQNYSFRNVALSETEYKMIKSLCALSSDDRTIILPICSYHNSNEKSDSVQKCMNQIFVNEFNRRWSDARNILHKKCLDDLMSPTAEPKVKVAHDQEQNGVKMSVGFKEYKPSHKESKGCSQLVDIKTSGEKGATQANILTPEFYRISSQRFQTYLSFGIKMIEGIVDRSERKKSEEKVQKERYRDIEREKIREHWMLKVSQRKKTRESAIHVIKESPHVTQTDLKVVTNEENKKPLYEIIARPSIPNIWLEEGEASSNNVIVKWDSTEKDISYFSLSTDGFSWTDSSEDKNGFELSRDFCLKRGYEYHFSAKVVLLNRQESEEATLKVTTSPPIPEAPVLLRSSDRFLELKWKIDENEEFIEGETSHCKFVNGVRLDRKFIIQLYDKGKWIDSSIGSETCTASVFGLRPDTSYQVRVICRVDGHPDVEGQVVSMCTKQRLPSKPDVIRHELSASSVSLEWKMPKNNPEDINCEEIRKLFNECITESKGYINKEEFHKILVALGSKTVQETLLGLDKFLGEENYLGDVIMKWRKFMSSILFMQRLAMDGTSSPWVEVYRGDGTKVKISNLEADTKYAFKICHFTLRSKSGDSDTVFARTLPDCPSALNLVTVDSQRLDLKVDKAIGSKCVLQIKEASRNRDSKTSWKTIYQGKSELIHIPFLRSKTKYDLQCFLLNKEGRKGKSTKIAFATSETTISFDDNTNPGLFQIYTSTDDLVPGDLILLNEALDEDSIDFESGIFEYTLITRVLSTAETFHMEIVHDFFDSRNHGKRIQRNRNQMNAYEILRMKWIDEHGRR